MVKAVRAFGVEFLGEVKHFLSPFMIIELCKHSYALTVGWFEIGVPLAKPLENDLRLVEASFVHERGSEGEGDFPLIGFQLEGGCSRLEQLRRIDRVLRE